MTLDLFLVNVVKLRKSKYFKFPKGSFGAQLTPLVSTMRSMKAPANPALRLCELRRECDVGGVSLQKLLGFSMRLRLAVRLDVVLVCLGSLEWTSNDIYE